MDLKWSKGAERLLCGPGGTAVSFILGVWARYMCHVAAPSPHIERGKESSSARTIGAYVTLILLAALDIAAFYGLFIPISGAYTSLRVAETSI